MLHEIPNVKQEPGGGRRRWFESDGLELVVWLGGGENLSGFQLCYDIGKGEHALTWRDGAGFSHSVVDSGDITPLKNQTPVLTPDGSVPWKELTGLFDENSAELDADLRQFIHGKLVGQEGGSAR